MESMFLGLSAGLERMNAWQSLFLFGLSIILANALSTAGPGSSRPLVDIIWAAVTIISIVFAVAFGVILMCKIFFALGNL